MKTENILMIAGGFAAGYFLFGNKSDAVGALSKYIYYKVIQQNWGYGWDDVDFHETNSSGFFKTQEDRKLFKDNLKAYRENQPGVPLRVIQRKELR